MIGASSSILWPAIYRVRGGSAPSGDWILATGFWNDSGAWDDTAVWID